MSAAPAHVPQSIVVAVEGEASFDRWVPFLERFNDLHRTHTIRLVVHGPRSRPGDYGIYVGGDLFALRWAQMNAVLTHERGAVPAGDIDIVVSCTRKGVTARWVKKAAA